jgi:hypothetical protein
VAGLLFCAQQLPTDEKSFRHAETAAFNASCVVNFAGSAARASPTIISASSGANIFDEEGNIFFLGYYASEAFTRSSS